MINKENSNSAVVSAVAIRNGVFISVGNDEDVIAYKDKNTKTIDANGRTIIPGLVDSHIHIMRAGLIYTMELRGMVVHPILQQK